ncbi:chalcone isomerase family protein [Roseateles sp. BYS180W]|uniref:Chalcone isomerase family protein n=1 Tax=Roseateles rivi TaxID=3299028 RepID=A0ABW7FS10_9BURK
MPSPTTPTLRRRTALLATAALPLTLLPCTMTQAATDTAPAVPAELAALLPQARLVGKGSLRFFGLMVYEARLWAAPGFEPQRWEQHAFGLELQYARKLEGSAIAERSVAEMRRIGPFSQEQAQRWLALMTRAFPDVVAQDRLLGWHRGQGEVRFLHNGRPTADLTDADFARLFFGIWLAPQTSAPALREALLGLNTR